MRSCVALSPGSVVIRAGALCCASRGLQFRGHGLRRLGSTQTANRSSPKSFEQIAREMAERKAQHGKGFKLAPRKDRFSSHKVSRELSEPLVAGDLVLVNSQPHIVLKTPDDPAEKYLLANHVGIVNEAILPLIDARLMQLIPPHVLTRTKASLFASDDTIGAPLKIAATDDQSDGGVGASLDKPGGRVVSSWIYKMISLPLRRIYELASRRATELRPHVSSVLNSCQPEHSQAPKVLPFISFVEQVAACATGDASVVDFYATRMCLDHPSLDLKYQLNMSYSSSDALMILPKGVEQRILDCVKHDKEDYEFLRYYARANLPDGPCEARAIELLRKEFPSIGYIDAAVAAELLQLPYGGVLENGWFQWMFQAAHATDRAKTLENFVHSDALHSQREEFSAPVYCIDSPDAKEIDDGISLERLGANKFKLGIHIANPSAFFHVKHAIPSILPLTTSVYLGNDSTLPMLPKQLVEPANLLANQESKPSLSLFVELDTKTRNMSNIVIKPLRLTRLHNITASDISRSQKPFDEFHEVALCLLQKRYDQGAFSFRTYIDETFTSIMGSDARSDGEVIVTEFMNLANHLVAKYCNRNNIPVLYRRQFLQAHSPAMSSGLSRHMSETRGLLGLPWQSVVQRGRTTTAASSHAGIGVDMATRFTSPLRRLDDLITHAQLEAHLLNRELPFSRQDLASLCDWMQLSQELSTRISVMYEQYHRFAAIKPNQEVSGVVSIVEPDTRAGSTSIYLPHHKISAKFVGDEPLEVEQQCTFIVNEVSAGGRYATVSLKQN